MDDCATEPRGAGRDGPDRGRWWAWTGWGIPRSLDDIGFLDVAAVVLVALTIWGYVDVWPHGRITPGRIDRHKTDFTVYTEAGAAFFDGRNPYRVTSPRGWYYLYPPLFALLVSPLAALDTEAQVFAWYLLSAAMAFGCYFEARTLWRLMAGEDPPGRIPARWIGVCVALTVFLPALDCLQRGQLGIALLYLLMVGFRLVIRSRSWPGWLLGGMVLALPAVVKLIPLLPVGFLVAQQWAPALRAGRPGRRARVRAVAVTAGVALGGVLFLFAIPSALVGWRPNLGYLHTWTAEVAANREVGKRSNFDIHSPRNQSLSNAVHLWTAPRHPVTGFPTGGPRSARVDRIGDRAVQVVRGLTLALLAVLAWTSGRRDHPLDHAMGYGLACCATILISPLSWGHYYMIELPAILAGSLWLARRASPTVGGLVAAVPALLAWTHYVKLRDLGPTGLLGLGTSAWFLVLCVSILGIDRITARGRARDASRLPGPHRLIASRALHAEGPSGG